MLFKRKAGGVATARQWLTEEKLLADSSAFTTIAPRRVYLSMSQNAGAPCAPVVRQRDKVLLGQLVGNTDEPVGAPVHASVSGTVLTIEERPQPGGKTVTMVVIENDGENRWHPDIAAHRPADRPSPEEIRALARRAGLVGMGGAGFPTAVKLDVGKRSVDTLLLNGAECEPGIACDNALMLHRAALIAEGMRLAMAATGARRGLVGIERSSPAALAALEDTFRTNPAVEVRALETRYPQGGEKQLIYALTGREVPAGALPADVGAVVLNVGTAAALAEAVGRGAPVVQRLCTVTGSVAAPQNVLFPIGTPVCDLIDHCGGFRGTPSKVIVGGPMMGFAVDRLTLPMNKGSNGIVVIGEAQDALYKKSPCIRCNRCLEGCPVWLEPWRIERYWLRDDLGGCERLRAEACINCGCCTYTCPARRPLAERIFQARGAILDRRRGEADG